MEGHQHSLSHSSFDFEVGDHQHYTVEEEGLTLCVLGEEGGKERERVGGGRGKERGGEKGRWRGSGAERERGGRAERERERGGGGKKDGGQEKKQDRYRTG